MQQALKLNEMRRKKGLGGGFRVVVVVVIFLNILLTAVAKVTEPLEEKEAAAAAAVKVKVGVVLDLNVIVGKMSLSCISMALADFYASRSYYKTRIILNPIDSNGSVIRAAAAGSILAY
ncbi:hypothetical protein IC582_006114 [Cucumis melo]